jgi:hypothetical protein
MIGRPRPPEEWELIAASFRSVFYRGAPVPRNEKTERSKSFPSQHILTELRSVMFEETENALLDIAAQLCLYRGRSTLGAREVQAAIRILGLPRILVSEGTKACTAFHSDEPVFYTQMYLEYRDRLRGKLPGYLVGRGMPAYMFGAAAAESMLREKRSPQFLAEFATVEQNSSRELLRKTAAFLSYLRRKVMNIDDVRFVLQTMYFGETVNFCEGELSEDEITSVVTDVVDSAIIHKKFVREFNRLAGRTPREKKCG